MVIPYSEIDNFNNELVLKNDIKEQYRSFLDIINSIKNRLEKYLIKVEIPNLTKDYNLIKENNYDIMLFSKHLDKMIKENYQMQYQVNNDLGDAVKIMTIHKYKGLE